MNGQVDQIQAYFSSCLQQPEANGVDQLLFLDHSGKQSPFDSDQWDSSPSNTPGHASPQEPQFPSPSNAVAKAPLGVPQVNISSTEIFHLLEEQDLKRKRLARKAELARMSRKRKKMRMGDLEQENSRLQAELDRIRKHRKQDQEQLVRQAQQLLDSNWEKMNVPADPQADDLKVAVKAVIDAHKTSSNGLSNIEETKMAHLIDDVVNVVKRREISARMHLSALDETLEPCMALRFMQWAMCQSDKFFTDNNGLWSTLMQHELKVTPEQMSEILGLRPTLKQQQQTWTEVENTHRLFNTLLRQHLSNTSAHMIRLRSILTIEQMARYIAWVEQYGPICVKINV